VRRISHRELRNNSSEVLRDVLAGEIIEVTNHGEVTAVLVPPSLTPYERLVAAGKVRQPVDLRSIRRVKSGLLPGRLRSADAIHLATALRVDARAMVVYDEELRSAAMTAGIRVLAPK
jgi:prevent-host-death family protein